MPLKRPAPRGSRYSKKIDPKTFYVAYEGAEEEKEYFSLFASRIKKRFLQNIKFIPVDKSSTDAEPVHVLADLEKRIQEDGIKFNTSNDIEFYIVIDTDHHFIGTHVRETSNVLQQCRQKGIKVALTNPSFELWLLCHLEDLTLRPDEFKQELLKNEKVTRHNTFAKVTWSKCRNGLQINDVLEYIEQALENEEKLNNECKDPLKMPPDGLYSGVGDIFRALKNCGISFD